MRTLTTTTKAGREVTLRVDSAMRPLLDIPALGIQGMAVRRDKQNGMDVLGGYAVVGGKSRPVGIEITSEVERWLAEAEAEERAYNEARMEVFYWQGCEGHTVAVDSRLSDDEIIARMPQGFWGEENTPETFRERLQEARAERAAEKAEDEAERKRFEAAKAEAARTGENVLLRQHMVECDGSAQDCSQDFVRVFVRPDGTTRVERTHTF